MGMHEVSELQRQGRGLEAEDCCRREMLSRPFDPVPCHALATLLHGRGRDAEAVELMRRAVALAPRAAEPRVNLAVMLTGLGRPELALDVLGDAVKLRADLPELHSNLGVVLEALGRPAEAMAAYRTAVSLRPNYPEAHFNLGNALCSLGRLADAITSYGEAVRLRPAYAKARHALTLALAELGDFDEALRHLRCVVALAPGDPTTRSAMLYAMHYEGDCGAEELWREHRHWGRLHCDPLKETIAAHTNDRDPERRLRVGYVSPDFCEATPPRFITAALRHHDRDSFELFGYSDTPRSDSITAALRRLFDHWADTRRRSDRQLAEMIRADDIDILVDLRGHAADNRLPMFCLKPAPVQVNMVGYFDTTGLATMDYRITDDLQDPVGQTEQYHTETLVRLPGSCWCYTADEDAPDVAEPPVFRNGHITFGSLNKIIKVSEPCARLWARVLREVPASRLLLSVAGADAGETVRKRLESYGLPPDRLMIVDKTRSRREYLMRFNEIDIALDTWPFNGITTTCDGLWMGVPCVSLTGRTSVSRAGKSILHAAGLAEFSTESPEAFVEAAVSLAGDTGRLRELRRSMRDRLLASTLMDHRGFGRKLERAYRRMWRAWCGRSGAGENG